MSLAAAHLAAPKAISHRPSFVPLRQVRAGLLDIGYAELGPADGQPVLLLHGWPYDIHTYAEAAPMLAAKGYRVIIPYLRGYGTTRFLSADTPRNGQQSVFADDMIALLDALGLKQAIVAGCDWGARTACILAALWPARFPRSRFGQRLSDRQPARQQQAARSQSGTVVVVSILLFDGTRSNRLRSKQERFCQTNLATRFAEVDISMRLLSRSLPKPCKIRIMSRLSSTTTAGGSVWLRANADLMQQRGRSPQLRRSPFPLSRWKVTRTAHHILNQHLMPASFWPNMNIEPFEAALVIIYRRKRPKSSQKRWMMLRTHLSSNTS